MRGSFITRSLLSFAKMKEKRFQCTGGREVRLRWGRGRGNAISAFIVFLGSPSLTDLMSTLLPPPTNPPSLPPLHNTARLSCRSAFLVCASSFTEMNEEKKRKKKKFSHNTMASLCGFARSLQIPELCALKDTEIKRAEIMNFASRFFFVRSSRRK